MNPFEIWMQLLQQKTDLKILDSSFIVEGERSKACLSCEENMERCSRIACEL